MCGKPLRASFIQYKSVKQGYFSKGTLDEFELGNLCIGYLDHPFEKEAPGLSPLASFSWSGSTQLSIQEGNRSGFPEKTPCNGDFLRKRSAKSGKATKLPACTKVLFLIGR